jgi:hypothetical protein
MRQRSTTIDSELVTRCYLWQLWLRSAIWSVLVEGEAATSAPQREHVETIMSRFAALGRRTKRSVLMMYL